MGLLRKMASRVVGRVRGGHASQPDAGAPASAAPASAAPASVAPASAAPSADAAQLASIECGPQELKERLDCGELVVIVDVRVPDPQARSLPGARSLALEELDTRWQELAAADEIVCTCDDGTRSTQAARFLRSRGLINATCLEGGLAAWAAVGGRLEPLGA